ncbi:MAG: glycosyltransferase family 39 protein [Chitinispirillaceae bacterium]|jgi:4-amino-4-deoxy-L-arabinose transferase-like glycosyltransferase
MARLLGTVLHDAARDRAGPILSGIVGCYLLGIVIATKFLRCEPWGDESHYIETVRLFVASFSIHTVKTYAEMHPPLSYMLYALAGIVCGDHIWVYRLVTLFCACITISTLFLIVRSLTGSNPRAFAGIILFMMNPYVIGLSVFVYSDMPGLMFLSLAMLAALHRRPWLFCLAAACAILCRQYNIFGPLAAAVWALIVWIRSRRSAAMPLVPLAALLSLIPAVLLFLYWGDIAPPNGMAHWNPEREQGFHPTFLITYLTMLPVYTAPAIIYYWRQIVSVKRLGTALVTGLVYWVFPVQPSLLIVKQTDIYTVGFFHKAVKAITGGNSSIEHCIFYLLFSLSLCLVFWLIAATVAARRDGNWRSTSLLFGGVITLCFFAVMSCAYNVWEKYLVMILPFFLGWILACAPTCTPLKTSMPVRNED